MRLTLRNLLAYLHEMMSPVDRVEFEHLLAASPRVAALLDRCRKVSQRRELAAPNIDQANPLHAAEVVASYIDFALPDQQLPSFETAALGSDEQLAEIVDSHRVLADIVCHRISEQHPPWKGRLLALLDRHSNVVATDAHSPPDVPRENWTAAERKMGTNKTFSIERTADATLLHNSGDLAAYLQGDEDDDSVLSEESAKEREHSSIIASVAEHNAATPAGAAAAKALALFGPEPAVEEPVEPHARRRRKRHTTTSVPPAAIFGGIGTVALVATVAVLLVFRPWEGGPPKTHIYGIVPTKGELTSELVGRVQFAVGDQRVPDVGAIIVAWPVGKSTDFRQSAQVLLGEMKARQQAHPTNLVVAAEANLEGNYHLRMLDHPEFHVIILSERQRTDQPMRWGEGWQQLSKQFSDPELLIQKRVYYYQTVKILPANQATLNHTFGPDS
jgi:hypothetical protein